MKWGHEPLWTPALSTRSTTAHRGWLWTNQTFDYVGLYDAVDPNENVNQMSESFWLKTFYAMFSYRQGPRDGVHQLEIFLTIYDG